MRKKPQKVEPSLFDMLPTDEKPTLEEKFKTLGEQSKKVFPCPKCGYEGTLESLRHQGMRFCGKCSRDGDNFYFDPSVTGTA